MSVQTSVSFNPAVAIAGGVQGVVEATNDRYAEVAIQAGVFVCQGTADGQCKLPTSSAEVGRGLGIAPSRVTSDSRFPAGGSSGVSYQIGDTVGAIPRGKVWVTVEEAVDPTSTVYVRYATGSGTQKGAFRASADTSTAAALQGAKYLTTAGIGGLALVAINLPQ